MWRVTVPLLLFAALGALTVYIAPGNAARADLLKHVPLAYAVVYAAIQTVVFSVSAVWNTPLQMALLVAVGASIDFHARAWVLWAGLALIGLCFFIPALVGLQSDLRATFFPASILSGMGLWFGSVLRSSHYWRRWFSS